ncbi:olfactory receptor 5AN1-like [Dendropsophus ebraccatus]|uniref:olfactory receptor 5AN1-like n=1 Tax=Dendropsophus ebraccatus TaxID=150705 RepID=UPI003831361F
MKISEENNLTVDNTFFLLGFQSGKNSRIFLFCLLLVIYWGTICGNIMIITLVSTSKNLHTPMYFFISQLSISDVLLTTDIVPNTLDILLNNGAAITFPGCLTQFYFFSASEFYTQEINLTEVSKFFLLGFQVSHILRLFLFCLFLVVYWGTICRNLLIIILVSTSKILHTPMYFFISQLSISDILLTTDIVPNLLHVLLNNGVTIAFIDCIIQFYVFGVLEVSEFLLLAVMSYDRYVAICNPLRYSSIMTSTYCVILTIICWLSGFSIILISSITMSKLNFCGPNVIDHVFCDMVPLLELSCSDAFVVHLEMYLLGIPVEFIPTVIIIVSYTYIVLNILKIPSSTGRQKAFSTCSSHLIVVSIFYWTMFCVYVVPTKGLTVTMSKILSLLYTVFTPLVNLIIYSLRNKDIMKAEQYISG